MPSPDVVSGALAADLDEDGNVHDVLPIPLLEGGQQLQTIAGHKREGEERGREGRRGEERNEPMTMYRTL